MLKVIIETVLFNLIANDARDPVASYSRDLSEENRQWCGGCPHLRTCHREVVLMRYSGRRSTDMALQVLALRISCASVLSSLESLLYLRVDVIFYFSQVRSVFPEVFVVSLSLRRRKELVTKMCLWRAKGKALLQR
jgi:hypothetical protein